MNIFQILGYNTASQYPATSKTNVYYYALIKASGTTYSASISEAASGADSISSAFSNSVNASISEAASGVDSASSLAVYTGYAYETASGIDSTSSLGDFVAYVYEGYTTFYDSYALLPLGSQFLGAQIIDGFSNSFGRVVNIANGSGSGSSGGFNAGGNYMAFGYLGSGVNIIYTNSFNFTNATSITLTIICGDNNNGGYLPATNLVISTYNVPSTFIETVATVLPTDYPTWTTVTISLSSASQVPNVRLRLATISFTGIIFGVKDFRINYSSLVGGVDETSSIFYPGAVISESASAIDQVDAVASFQSSVSETSSGSDENASSVTFISAISETGSGIDSTVGYISFPSGITETSSGVDQISSLRLLPGSISEAASGIDSQSTAAVFNANVEASTRRITQLTSTLPTGTSFSGAVIFNSSSASGGLAVVANGTGSGSTGGFNAGGNYILFSGANTRSVKTTALDLTLASTIDFYMIKGNNSNGGDLPDSGENITLSYSINGGSSYTVISTVILGGATPIVNPFTLFSVSVPVGAKTLNTILKWEQVTSNAGVSDQYGLKDIVIYESLTAYAGDSPSATLTLPSTVQETASALDEDAVAASTFNAYSAETASGVDSVDSFASFGVAVDETGSGVDEVSTAQTFATDVSEAGSGVDQVDVAQAFVSSIAETSSGIDSQSTAATFNASINEPGYVIYQQITSSLPTGTTFTGSTIFNSSSASGGLTVAANGTGSGTTGGFIAGGNYILFTGANTRSVKTIALDLTKATTVDFYMIKGTSSNGGELPDAGENITLSYSINGGSSYTVISTVIAGGSTPVVNPFTLFSVAVPAGAKTASTILKWEEVTSSGSSSDTYGLKNITIYALGVVGASDSQSTVVDFGAAVTEAASGVDEQLGNVDFGASVEETSEIVDESSATQDFAVNVDEAGAGIDEIIASQDFASAIDETASALDEDAVAASEFNAYSEEQASGEDLIAATQDFVSAVDEAASGVDSDSALQDFAVSVEEASSGQEEVSALQDFAVSVEESASGLDMVDTFAAFSVEFIDSAAGLDSISSSTEYGAAIQELASGVDEVYSNQDFGSSIEEGASGYDLTDAAGSIYAASFADSASGIDLNSTNFTYNIIVPEGAGASGVFYARYLWELIDNSETADWVVIQNTQSVSWAQIDDTQTSNWQNVDNSQSSGWGEIDNTDSANWQDIQT